MKYNYYRFKDTLKILFHIKKNEFSLHYAKLYLSLDLMGKDKCSLINKENSNNF